MGVVRSIAHEFGVNKESLRRCGANGEMRRIAAELLYKYCDITQSQIGSYLGDIDYVSVYHLRRRLREKMSEHPEVRKRYEKAEAKVKSACIM
ncbi:MAG: hypothetical protein ACUVTF_09585 [bacterium]